MGSSSAMKAVTFFLAALALTALAVPGAAFLTSHGWGPHEPSWLWVGTASSLPDDGIPQLRAARRIRRDAWSVSVEADGRHVFLRRIPGSGRLVAFPPYHESNGLRVGLVYDADRGVFHSVCRKVDFALDGRLQEAERFRPISEDLHPLPVKEEGGDVFVSFENISPLAASRDLSW